MCFLVDSLEIYFQSLAFSVAIRRRMSLCCLPPLQTISLWQPAPHDVFHEMNEWIHERVRRWLCVIFLLICSFRTGFTDVWSEMHGLIEFIADSLARSEHTRCAIFLHTHFTIWHGFARVSFLTLAAISNPGDMITWITKKNSWYSKNRIRK